MPKTKINKTAFILEYPDMPAAALVKLAALRGIKISDKYVYNIRAKARGAARAGKTRRKQKSDAILQAANGARRAGGLPGRPQVAELIMLVDGQEVIALRMPADVAGPALYATISGLLAPPR